MKCVQLAVLLLLACAPMGCEREQSRRDDAVDRPLTITLQRRYAIGGAADTGFTPALLFPHDVAGGNAGQLYVLDRSKNQVLAMNDRSTALLVTHVDTNLVVRVEHDVTTRLALAPPVAMREVAAYNACGLLGTERPPLLTASLLATGTDSVIAVNESGAFGITLHQPGQSPRQLQRARAREPLTAGLALTLLGDSDVMIIGRRPCAVPMSVVAQQAGIAATVPAYRSIVIDHTGHVWAMRTVAVNTPHLVDIYSIADGYLGTASLGAASPVAFLSDGALVAIERDADDAPVVVVYDVVAPALGIATRR